MSNATWQIMSLQPEFVLAVTAESERRPGTVYQWRGKIEIHESGNQYLRCMFLDSANGVSEETTLRQTGGMAVLTWIPWTPHEDETAAAFAEVAKTCDEDTQRMEKNFMEQQERKRQDRERVSGSIHHLKQLEAEGIHNVVSTTGENNSCDVEYHSSSLHVQ